MRLLILTATAALFISGTAMAAPRHHHAAAPAVAVSEGSAPADTLGAHALYVRNLQDSGYNRAGDLDAAGNIRQN